MEVFYLDGRFTFARPNCDTTLTYSCSTESFDEGLLCDLSDDNECLGTIIGIVGRFRVQPESAWYLIGEYFEHCMLLRKSIVHYTCITCVSFPVVTEVQVVCHLPAPIDAEIFQIRAAVPIRLARPEKGGDVDGICVCEKHAGGPGRSR